MLKRRIIFFRKKDSFVRELRIASNFLWDWFNRTFILRAISLSSRVFASGMFAISWMIGTGQDLGSLTQVLAMEFSKVES